MLVLVFTALFCLGSSTEIQHKNAQLKQTNRVLLKALNEIAVGFQYDTMPFQYSSDIWNDGKDKYEDGPNNFYYRQTGKCMDWCEDTPAMFSRVEIDNENGAREDCFSTCSGMADCFGFQYQDEYEASNGDWVLPKCWFFTDPSYEGEWNCIAADFHETDYECWTTTAPFGDNYVLQRARAAKKAKAARRAKATSRSHA